MYADVTLTECKINNENTATALFENMAKFKLRETIITNQNYFYSEVKSRLNLRIAFYRSDQKLLPSYRPSREQQITIFNTIM
jgi:hypothetical protein